MIKPGDLIYHRSNEEDMYVVMFFERPDRAWLLQWDPNTRCFLGHPVYCDPTNARLVQETNT